MTGTYSLQVRQVGDHYVATGSVKVGLDYAIRATARVSAKAIEQAMRAAARGWRGKIGAAEGDLLGDEIGWGFLKKLWKGAKKIAKKVASSKVLGKIAKVVRNPVFMAALSVVPGVGPVAAAGLAAASTAYMGYRAAMGVATGKRGLAKAAIRAGSAVARKYGVPAARAKRAFNFGRKLAFDPRMLQFMYRGPMQRGGIQQMLPPAQSRVPRRPPNRIPPQLQQMLQQRYGYSFA